MYCVPGILNRYTVPGIPEFLRHGLEAGGSTETGEAVAEAIEARLRTGRPLAAEEWIARQEAAIGLRMRPAKRGPKKGSGDNYGS